MMLAARGAIRASGAGLPYDAEVEYLQGDGASYIATGLVWNPYTTKATVVAYTPSVTRQYLLGSYGSSHNYLGYLVATPQLRVTPDGSPSLLCNVNEWNTLECYNINNTWYNVANGVSSTISNARSDTSRTLDIFRINDIAQYLSTSRIARLYLTDIASGALVADYIPVRKKTVGYLYERVSGRLFGNAGTGDFALGPDVVPVEYLESHGTEYIDTGIGYYADFEIKVKMRASLSNITLYSGGYNRLERISAALPYWRFRSNAGGTYDSTIPITELHTLAWRNGKIYSDGAEIYQLSKPYQNYEMYAFGTNTSAFPCVIYYLDLWDSNNTPVRKFQPVRVGTDATSWEGAMMDVLTRRIYRNAGTGAFTYGNDLKYPIPA